MRSNFRKIKTENGLGRDSAKNLGTM